MRKVICGAFISLDGVMQAPGGPQEDPTGGFQHEGWVPPYWDEAMDKAMGETFSRPFDLLLGRETYDIFAAHWPYVETPGETALDQLNDDISVSFNKVTKFVATHRPETLTWVNSQALGEDVPAAVRALKAGDGPDLLMQGSTQLLHQLFAHDLVDELRLLIFPIVLGKGKRLFGEDGMPSAFKLTTSTTTSTGALIASYERAGEIQTGDFGQETPNEAELERRKRFAGR